MLKSKTLIIFFILFKSISFCFAATNSSPAKCANLLTASSEQLLNLNLQPVSSVRSSISFQVRRKLSTQVRRPGYFSAFGNSFKTKLLALTRHQHWIDLGAGSALAIQEYYTDFKGRASSQGVTFRETMTYKEDVRGSLPDHSEVLSGRLFESIPNSEFKQADIITDLYGVMSYTEDLSLALKKALSLLKTNGSLFLLHGQRTDINDEKTHIRILHPFSNGPKTSYQVKSLTELVSYIPGLEIRTHKIVNDIFSIEIIKREGFSINSIPNLELIRFDDGTPPYRVFHTVE